jgi:hypothetical protein
MGLESTPFGADVKRASTPERVSQKVPDVVPNVYLGLSLLMDGEWLVERVHVRRGMAVPFVALAKEGQIQNFKR